MLFSRKTQRSRGARLAAPIVAFTVVLALAVPAGAVPAITGFVTAGYQNTNASADRTLGWIFTALDTVAVTHLGVWDRAGDGLVAAHRVGIWDAGGTLLGSTSVQAGTASLVFGTPMSGGRFRYETVSGIALAAGGTYTIGALFDTDDVFEFNAAHVDTGASIAFGEERYGEEGAGFVLPTETFERWGLFGPNFLYSQIPEPAAAALFGLGLAGLAAALRGRRRRSAAV